MAKDITNRPEKVAIAAKLLYVAFAVGVVRSFTLVETYYDTRSTASAAQMFAMYSILLFMFFCVYMAGKGRSWARIFSLALGAAVIPFSIFKDLHTLAIDPMFGVFGFGQVVFVIMAAVIFFQRESNDWFRG